MQHRHHGSPRSHIMQQVDIDITCEDHMLPKWFWCIQWEDLLHIAVDHPCPIVGWLLFHSRPSVSNCRLLSQHRCSQAPQYGSVGNHASSYKGSHRFFTGGQGVLLMELLETQTCSLLWCRCQTYPEILSAGVLPTTTGTYWYHHCPISPMCWFQDGHWVPVVMSR